MPVPQQPVRHARIGDAAPTTLFDREAIESVGFADAATHAGDITGPEFIADPTTGQPTPYAYDITETSAKVTFTCAEGVTGQTEIGYSLNDVLNGVNTYFSGKQDDWVYSTHIQTINPPSNPSGMPALEPGTTYYYRCYVEDPALNLTVSDVKSFTTAGGSSPTVADVYGNGAGADSPYPSLLDSTRVLTEWSGASNKVAFRFRANASGTPERIMFRRRTDNEGVGFSLGTQGTLRVRLCPDDGNGYPDESTYLATLDYDVPAALRDAGMRDDTVDLPWDPNAAVSTSSSSDVSAYGQSCSGDSRNNWGPGNSWQGCFAVTFKAPATDTVTSISWPLRTDTEGGYSAGTGGDPRWAIYPANADGSPNTGAGRIGDRCDSIEADLTPFETGTIICRQTWSGSKPSLTEGELYVAVLENIHADPVNNHVCINRLLTWGSDDVPGFDDVWGFDNVHKCWTVGSSGDPGPYVVTGGMSWERDWRNHCGLDVEFTGGERAGQAVNNHGGSQSANSVFGGSIRRRERIIVSGGDRVVDTLYARLSRQSGTGSATLALKDDAGTTLASVVVPYSDVITWTHGDYGSPQGNWVGGAIPETTLADGQTYYVEASAPSGTQYTWPVVHYEWTNDTNASSKPYAYTPGLLSPAFRDGNAEYSTNGGSTWGSVYLWTPTVSQMTLRLTGSGGVSNRAVTGDLVAGNRYHVVFENVDADPASNFSAVNVLSRWTPQGEFGPDRGWPVAPNDDLMVLDWGSYAGVQEWRETSSGHDLPIFEVVHSNGSQGQPYYAAMLGQTVDIGGANMVRQRFVPPSNQTVNSIYLYAGRITGSGDLTISLNEVGGATLASVVVPAASTPIATKNTKTASDSLRWVGGSIDAVITAGVEYEVVASAPSGTEMFSRVNNLQALSSQNDPYGQAGQMEHGNGGFPGAVTAEFSSNSGTSWAAIWQAMTHLTTVMFLGAESEAAGLPPSVDAALLDEKTTVASSQPSYLVKTTDPVFGTEIMRISDIDGQRHRYSNLPAWNCDQTRLVLDYLSGQRALLDAFDYSILVPSLNTPQWATWSFVDPDLMFGGGSSGTSAYRTLVPSTNSVTVHTISRPGGGSYDTVAMSGSEQTGLTWDDHYMVFGWEAGTDYGMGVIDTTTETVVAEHTFANAPEYPSGGIGITGEADGSGNYQLVLSWGYNRRGTGRDDGFEVYDFDPSGGTLTFARQLSQYGAHSDVGKDMAGDWVACVHSQESYSPDGYAIGYYRLSDGAWVGLRPTFIPGHVSQRCWKLPGYALFSGNDEYPNRVGTPGNDELLLFELQPNGQVHRFGQMHRLNDTGYTSDPMACISPDGTLALWSTNWDNATGIYAYVAGMSVLSAPVISNITESDITETSARISWDVSPASTGQVFYGTTPGGPYPDSAGFESRSLTYHSQTLSPLVAGQTYYYVIQSGSTTSSEGSFSTPSVGGEIYYVSSIPGYDATWSNGTKDCTADFHNWLYNTVGSGTSGAVKKVVFPAGTFRFYDQGIGYGGMSYLEFYGAGASKTTGTVIQMDKSSTVTGQYRSNFSTKIYGGPIGSAHHITIHDFYGIGISTTPGEFNGSIENQSMIDASGTSDFEAYNLTCEEVGGDLIRVRTGRNGYVHDCEVVNAGRQCVSIIDAENWTFENLTVGSVGYYVIDLEPNANMTGTLYPNGGVVNDITFTGTNTFEAWSTTSSVGGGFLAAANGPGWQMNNVLIEGWTSTANNTDGNGVPCSNLRTYFSYDASGPKLTFDTRPQNITIRNCSVAQSASGTVLRFASIDNLDVRNVYQPPDGVSTFDIETIGTYACTNVLGPTSYYAPPAPTGGDDTSSLNTFFVNTPNGTADNPNVVLFEPTDVYRLDNRIELFAKQYLHIYGCALGAVTGAVTESTQRTRLNQTGDGSSGYHAWQIAPYGTPCHDVKIFGFHIVGGNAANYRTPDQWVQSHESDWGFGLYSIGGNYNFEIGYNVVEYEFGHAIYIRTNPGQAQWDNVYFHHNIVRGCGTMGLVNVNGNNIRFEDNYIYDTALVPIQCEDETSGSMSGFTVLRNHIEDWAWTDTWVATPAIQNMQEGVVSSDVLVAENTIAGAMHNTLDPNWDHYRGLISFTNAPGSSNIVVRDNVSTSPKDGTQVRIHNYDGVSVTGNAFTGSTNPLDGEADNPDVALTTYQCTNVTQNNNTISLPYATTYGPAFRGVAKGNILLFPGSGLHEGNPMAFRFKAEYGGTVDSVMFQATTRSGYAVGDAGIYTVGIQSVDSELKPTGTWLGGTATWDPTIVESPLAYNVEVSITGGPTLTQGSYYAVVIENISANVSSNYGSINTSWTSGYAQVGGPRQPHYPNDENLSMTFTPTGGWEVVYFQDPCFDLKYTSGDHEGYSNIQYQDPSHSPYYGIVNSGSKGRWSFTYPASRSTFQVDAVNFWVMKSSGSTNATVDVHVGGVSQATGTFLTSGAIAAGERAWIRAPLSSTVTIDPGDFVEVFIQTTAGEYFLPGQYGRDSTSGPPYLNSFPYTDSDTDYDYLHRADDGASGTTPVISFLYQHYAYCCYFEVAP